MARILLIDDSPTVLGLLSEALRAAGHEVIAESDIVAANRHVWRSRPDLLLLDVQMPMLSGSEVCRILKSKPETQGIPILFCSDLPEDELERLAADAGADGVVRKGQPLPQIVAEVTRRLR